MTDEELNQQIRERTAAFVQRLKAEQDRLGMKHISEGEKLTQIKTAYREMYDVISRIRFKFKRSGVFVHKGVGRGTRAADVGTTLRRPKEWFNPLIEEFSNELSELMADGQVEIIYTKLQIK